MYRIVVSVFTLGQQYVADVERKVETEKHVQVFALRVGSLRHHMHDWSYINLPSTIYYDTCSFHMPLF